MKNKILPLLAVSIIALTSCSIFNSVASSEKEIIAYNLDEINSGDAIEDAFAGTVKARFKDGEPLIPYLSLKDYASLYESRFSDGFTNKYTKKGTSVSWSIVKENVTYFSTEINFMSKEVTIVGAIEIALEADPTKDYRALSYGMSSSYDAWYVSGVGASYYSFGNEKIKYFTYNNNYYISLGFLDMTYSYNSGVYFYYNYQRIVSSTEADSFEEKEYKVDDRKLTVNKEMAEIVNGQDMPLYLRTYNAYLFLYFLDNFYGLKDEKGISDATNYCHRIGVYNGLFAKDDQTRVQSYADALSHLDDNHTALVSGISAWGEDEFNRWKYGEGCKKRSALKGTLIDTRATAYQSLTPGEDIIYSSDGKTAMYAFDNFKFGSSSEVFNNDGSIKDTAYQYDTYCNLIRLFETLNNKGGVENVILDISTNGGGVLGVMMKVLSLISNNGETSISYLETDIQELVTATTKNDINNDHETTPEDYFGDDFNIAIMTSDCSFSAANAFACYASYENICPIIGQKSGGGECAVAIHYLPNGEYLYHSSNLHIGYYNEYNGQFIGFESGAKPVFAIENTDDMYDIEYLNQQLPSYF